MILEIHDDVIKWKHFSRYWPFARGIHRSPMNSLHKGQWRGALMFSLICAWINDRVNNREASHLRRHRAHYDVTDVVQYNDKNIAITTKYGSVYMPLGNAISSLVKIIEPELELKIDLLLEMCILQCKSIIQKYINEKTTLKCIIFYTHFEHSYISCLETLRRWVNIATEGPSQKSRF